jgi:hypothetical protein
VHWLLRSPSRIICACASGRHIACTGDAATFDNSESAGRVHARGLRRSSHSAGVGHGAESRCVTGPAQRCIVVVAGMLFFTLFLCRSCDLSLAVASSHRPRTHPSAPPSRADKGSACSWSRYASRSARVRHRFARWKSFYHCRTFSGRLPCELVRRAVPRRLAVPWHMAIRSNQALPRPTKIAARSTMDRDQSCEQSRSSPVIARAVGSGPSFSWFAARRAYVPSCSRRKSA